MGMRHQLDKGNARVQIVQANNEFLAQGFVVVVQRLGDVFFSQRIGFEQVLRAVAEQIVRMQQPDKAGVTGHIQQLGGCSALVHRAAIAECIQPDLIAVAHQNKLAAGQVVGIFPGLLHRAFVAAGHECFEVGGFWPFEFKRSNRLPLVVGKGAQASVQTPMCELPSIA